MEISQMLLQAVKEYKAGNEESFTVLLKESEKYIYACIWKYASRKPDAAGVAEEISQETFFEIFRSIGSLEKEEAFLYWASAIALNKCKAHYRKNKKRYEMELDDSALDIMLEDDKIIPEEIIQNKEKWRILEELMEAHLSEIQRLCMYGYYYYQLKIPEIAKALEIPENTVKTNLARSRGRLKVAVVEFEKKKQTKLHSVAPVFLLLFAEDIKNVVVPAELGTKVMAFIAEASSASAAKMSLFKSIWAKIAAASTKTKVLVTVTTVSVTGTIGGAVYVASQNSNFSAETENIISVETDNTVSLEIEYVEMEPCYRVMRTEDVDTSLADGEVMDWTKWERLETTIRLKKSLDIYNEKKEKVGYTKEDIKAVYVSVEGEWSHLAIGETGLSVYVRTEELFLVIGYLKKVTGLLP